MRVTLKCIFMATMNEMQPLERLLQQITELYLQILSNQEKNLSVTPETLQRIQILSQEIDEIVSITNMELARAGISPELIKQTILGPKNQLPKDIKNLLEKSQYIKNQLVGCRNILNDAIKKQKDEKTSGGKRREAKKRKDKFKNIGGKEGWIPM